MAHHGSGGYSRAVKIQPRRRGTFVWACVPPLRGFFISILAPTTCVVGYVISSSGTFLCFGQARVNVALPGLAAGANRARPFADKCSRIR